MIRLYSYENNNIFKEFPNFLFERNDIEFDYFNDKLTIDGADYRISSMFNSNFLDKFYRPVVVNTDIIPEDIDFALFIFYMLSEELIPGKYYTFSTNVFGDLKSFTVKADSISSAIVNENEKFYKENTNAYYLNFTEITLLELIVTGNDEQTVLINSNEKLIL